MINNFRSSDAKLFANNAIHLMKLARFRKDSVWVRGNQPYLVDTVPKIVTGARKWWRMARYADWLYYECND